MSQVQLQNSSKGAELYGRHRKPEPTSGDPIACSRAPLESFKTIPVEKTVLNKICSVCKETLEGHFVPARPDRCLWKTVEFSFRTSTASNAAMTALIEQETSISADREQRLNHKNALLTEKKLGECQGRENTFLKTITKVEAKVLANAYQDDELVKKKRRARRSVSITRERCLIQQRFKV